MLQIWFFDFDSAVWKYYVLKVWFDSLTSILQYGNIMSWKFDLNLLLRFWNMEILCPESLIWFCHFDSEVWKYYVLKVWFDSEVWKYYVPESLTWVPERSCSKKKGTFPQELKLNANSFYIKSSQSYKFISLSFFTKCIICG